MTAQHFILYIEDERPMMELVRHVLKLAGYKVAGALNGEIGLETMRQEKPDLVLLDLMMPEVNGWEVYKVMKNDLELADIPVIVVTAKIPEKNRILVEGLPPVDDYITKPFDVERLLRAIKNSLVPTVHA